MKVRLVYLAAGNSRRFGSNKLLYPLSHKPMYRYGLEVMTELLKADSDRELVVVTRYEPILLAVEELRQKGIDRAFAIPSPESIHGISHSIRTGVLFGKQDSDYYLFMVADQPYIKADTIEWLIKETIHKQSIGGCVTWEGIPGNPVIFSKRLKDALLSLEGDKGGKSVLKPYMDIICRVPASTQEELLDKDTLEDASEK